jgi:hypothetical protein
MTQDAKHSVLLHVNETCRGSNADALNEAMHDAGNLLRRELESRISRESALGKETTASCASEHRGKCVAVLLVNLEVLSVTEGAIHWLLLDFSREKPDTLFRV